MTSSQLRSYDAIIVGQGIAGTVMAWEMMWSGQNVLIADRGEPVTCSKIAAGLVTPITGKRLVQNWKFPEFWKAAVQFYRRVEKVLGVQCFDELPMLRLFQSEVERDVFRTKQSTYETTVREVDETTFPGLAAPWGGFEMRAAGRLRVSEFLKASRSFFNERGCLLEEDLKAGIDFQFIETTVQLPKQNSQSQRVVFCQGHQSVPEPLFATVPYNPAKGEILTLRIPELQLQQILHCGVWLVPLGDGFFRCGATYEWDRIDNVPTEAGAADILERLKRVVTTPIEIVEHDAAVRPVLMDSRPRIGVHPKVPQAAFFNGLGSKGSLQAPLLAQQLTKLLTQGTAVDSDFALEQVWDIP